MEAHVQSVCRRPGGRHSRLVARLAESRRRQALHAREEVEAAILLVAGGHFPRVLISNIGDGGRCVQEMCGLADAAGVRLEALPRPDRHGVDVAVTAR